MRLALLATLLMTACASKPEAEPPKPAAATPAAAAAPAPAPEPLGGLTEEQFKAMHQPPAGTTIQPRGQMIDLAGTKAYLSLPDGQPPFPGITVIHEWWGLNDNIKLWADRLADSGYAALAVDLYGGVVATKADAAMEAMSGVNPEKARAILLAAHQFLKDDPRVSAPRRASIGWCFGGGQSLQLAIAAPDLDACVIYYGQPVLDPTQLAKIHAAILGHFGTQDQSIPQMKLDDFDAALTKAGVAHEIKRYDAPHAFANPSNPAYDQVNAAAAWETTQAFLAKRLRAP
jgi:carboxymethylenebutenolidase